jgi:hypothetical protein
MQLQNSSCPYTISVTWTGSSELVLVLLYIMCPGVIIKNKEHGGKI